MAVYVTPASYLGFDEDPPAAVWGLNEGPPAPASGRPVGR